MSSDNVVTYYLGKQLKLKDALVSGRASPEVPYFIQLFPVRNHTALFTDPMGFSSVS